MKGLNFSLTKEKEEESKKYDAEFNFKNGVQKKIEWVTAMDHYKDSLLLEYLKQYKMADPDEEIRHTGGNKGKRQFLEQKPDTSYFEDKHKNTDKGKIENNIKLIQKMISKKISKQKKGWYPNIVLGVIFVDEPDETLTNSENSSFQKIKNATELFLNNHTHDFEKIYLLRSTNYIYKIVELCS